MAYIYDLTDTWNAGGTTFNGIKLNVTDSASAAASKLVNLQTNGTEHFSVTKAGVGYFSGNVGIGTSSPSQKLVVNGNIRTNTGSGGTVTVFETDATRANLGIFGADASGAYLDSSYSTGGSGVLRFQTVGTERMRITSGGNVGIGTSSPTEKLDVVGNIYASGSIQAYGTGSIGTNLQLRSVGASPNIQFNRPSYQNWFMGSPDVSPDLYIAEGTSSTYRMYFASGGNVGIGTTSPTYKLVVSNGGAKGFELDPSTGIFQTYNRSTSAYSGLLIYAADQRFFTGTSPAERMRIDASGNLLVGTTSGSGARVSVTGAVAAGNFSSNSTSGDSLKYHFVVYENGVERGSITSNGSATAYNTSSDYRLKDIDGPIANSGAYIDALNPVQGSWKADGSRFIGLLAHEVQEVSETPIATGEKDGEEMQAMDYSAPEIIANLIAELQSLRARVAQLEGN